MFKHFLFLICCSAIASFSYAQVTGRVVNETGEPLAYASVFVKGSTIGVSANADGYYRLSLSPGSYTLVSQHIGYQPREVQVTVPVSGEVNFQLAARRLSMEEVVVKSNGEDPAYAIIREAIKMRSFYHQQVDESVVDLYAKDVLGLREMPGKVFGQTVPKEELIRSGLDSNGKGILYLHESISTVWRKKPDKLKMEVKSSRVSGSDGFGLSFPVVISLNTNNVMVFSERFNPRGFISPIADAALGFYRYKFLGNFFEDGRMIHSIRLTPRRKYEPLFSGTINITDGDWRVHSYDLLLTKESQLELLDTLTIRQIQVPVSKDVWQPQTQVMDLSARFLGIGVVGNFLRVYSEYDIEPQFTKKTFGNVVISYDTAVSSREKNWWDTVRPVPLNQEEVANYKFKDSTYQLYKDSSLTKNFRDSLRKQNRGIKLTRLILPPGVHKKHYADTASKDYYWGIEPLLLNTEYNPAEGVAISFIPYWMKRRKESEWVVEPVLRYGFGNGHFNPSLNIEHTTSVRGRNKKYSDLKWFFSGGKRVSQFNRDNPILPLMNTVSTLFYGQNYMKTYENYFGSVSFERKGENGFKWIGKVFYEDRLPLDNITDYVFFDKYRERIQPNYPIELMNENFTRHQALVVEAGFDYQPGQKYIQFPTRKVSIGSRMPVFGLRYTKGLNMLGSDVDFDRWKLDVYDTRNLRLAGTLRYLVGIGGFLNDKAVPVQDYQHFNGNLTRLLHPEFGTFQLASYYANSTTASFYGRAHVEHHFNGLFTNKIPLFKRLKWHLVGGANAFFVDENRNYVEAFVGLENILKIFRVDFIAGYENGRGTLTALKVGFGGIFSDRARSRTYGRTRNGNTMTLSF